MDKKIVKSIVLALCFAAIACNAYAYERGDFQIWHTDCEDIKIGKGTKFSAEQEFRFGENARELYYQHYQWGFVFGFHKMLDLGFFYRLILEKSRRKWLEEDRSHVNATVKFDLWKFKIDDRNRLEYRHFRYKDDAVRYRNKFTLKYPVDFAGITLLPYISDEIFISSNGTGFSENRFYSGMEFVLTKYAKADIYYLLKDNKIRGSKWTDAHVLGTKVKISF